MSIFRTKKNMARIHNIYWTLTKIKSLLRTSQGPYIFHHIPKCSGTSVTWGVLSAWFSVIADYPHSINPRDPAYLKKKINLDRLKSYHCLCGHYHIDVTHISH
ncbi:MAG: hypothetical protein AAF485_04665, partial [Chloroflexota bacterium]